MRPRPSPAPMSHVAHARRPLAILLGLLVAFALLHSSSAANAYDAARINSTQDIPVGLHSAWEKADSDLKNERSSALAGMLAVLEKIDGDQYKRSKSRVANFIANKLIEDGRFPEARELLVLALDRADAAGLEQERAMANVAIGRLLFTIGDEGGALGKLEAANQNVEKVIYYDSKAHVRHEYARVQIERGQLNGVIDALQAAREDIKMLSEREKEFNREVLYAENSALLGRALERGGRLDVALTLFERAVTDVSKRDTFDPIRGDAYVELGQYQWRRFNVGKARDVLNKALALYSKPAVNDFRSTANVHSLLGTIAFELGATSTAIKHYGDGLSAIGDKAPFWTATLSTARARAQIAIGNLDEAAADLEAALTALDNNPAPRLQASILRYRGALAQARGQYQDALDHRAQAVEIAKAAQDYHSIGDSLADLGETYLAIGNAERAEAAYSEAVANARKTDSKRMLARALTSLAVAQLRVGNHPGRERAVATLEEADRIAEEIGDTLLIATTKKTIAEAYAELGNLDRAAEYYGKALERVGNADLRLRVQVLVALGAVHVSANQAGKAKAPLDEANTLAQRLQDQGLIAECQAQLGRYEAARGNNGRAFEYFEQAAATIEASRATLVGSANKTALIAQNQLVFSNLVDLAARNDPTTARDAFAWAEKAKARTFLDQLAEAQQNIRAGVDPAFRNEEQELIRAIGQLRNTIAHLQSTGAAADALKPYSDDLTKQERAFAALRERIAARNPRYADLRYPTPADVAAVQRTLASGEVLLAYFVGSAQGHAWAITKTAIKHATLPGERELRRLVGYHRDLIVTGSPLAIAEFNRSATTLGRHLLAPFKSMLPKDADVIVAADGPLHYLPIETLFLEPPPGEHAARYDAMPFFVGHAARLRYVQSATVLVSLNNTPPAQGAGNYLVALGDPIFEDERRPRHALDARAIITRDLFARLPFTAGEVSALGALAKRAAPAGQPVTVYTRNDATEEALKALATNARYVHIATHGVLDERNPSFSGVVLTAQDGGSASDPAADDGYCYLVEIFNLQFKADLIVLSACETGLGRLVGGEGVEGLTRAFMYAGAPRSLVTLWSVDDESTADLMGDFYRHLWTDGHDPARALLTAKREMIKRDGGKFAAPFFWSPFVLFGRK